MAKILIAEDDVDYASLVSDWLTMEQHTVEQCHDGKVALELLERFGYDAIILDWDMPQVTGIDVCRRYRDAGGESPVLMLTGKTAIDEKEHGLDSGADDYLTKPAHPKELAARIRALLRRKAAAATNEISHGHVSINLQTHEVKVGGELATLLPREFALLEFLLRNAGRVFSTEELLNSVWSSEADAGPESVKTCVNRLRRKIDLPGKESLIRNIYSVGYVIDRTS